MRSTYPDYFEKQKTTDILPYSTREAHFANYANKLKLQIGPPIHQDACLSISGQW